MINFLTESWDFFLVLHHAQFVMEVDGWRESHANRCEKTCEDKLLIWFSLYFSLSFLEMSSCSWASRHLMGQYTQALCVVRCSIMLQRNILGGDNKTSGFVISRKKLNCIIRRSTIFSRYKPHYSHKIIEHNATIISSSSLQSSWDRRECVSYV